MDIKSFIDRFKEFLLEVPLPHSALQVSSAYVSGVSLSAKERKLRSHFILPLPQGAVRSSFGKENIQDASLLERTLRAGVEKLQVYDHGAAVLLPELAQRTFVFSFTTLPSSSEERERIIRHRVKKQLPLLPQDSRLAYEVLSSGRGKKVVSSLARSAVVEDYERFFSRLQVKIRMVGVPLLGLSRLIDWEKESDFLLVNLEQDAFGLLAVVDGEVFLCRQKSLLGDTEGVSEEEMSGIIQEIENTAHFIEDKEKRKVATAWVRFGILGAEEEGMSRLSSGLDFPVRDVADLVEESLGKTEKRLLSPLLGLIR